ncbi:MAG: hybrid sensor histidine kinase/response regulator [Eubacterium sp.]|nr:hybrid sensor histidine kinase/response regulator [Eubacterium sp.]
MDYKELINTQFSEPAAIVSYNDGVVKALEINDRFIPELWMNISVEDYLDAGYEKIFDEANFKIYKDAVEKCIKTGETQVVETWRNIFSNCCGFDKICLKSRFIFLEKTPEGAVVYEGIRNISNEKRTQNDFEDMEYRYKALSDQVNIYNWEYTIATKEMRPCYRCMRDLGVPALVKNYPEPLIDAGIFPQDYADMYRDFMRKIDEGAPELEVDIPLTVGRVPFRVKYTTEFDENGKPVKAFGSATLISDKELGRIKVDNQIIQTLAEGYTCIYLADFAKNSVKIVKQEDVFSIEDDAYIKELAEVIAAKFKDMESKYRVSLNDLDALKNALFADCDTREFVYKDAEENRWIRINFYVIDRVDAGVDKLLITVSVVDNIRAKKMESDRLIESQKIELEDRQKILLSAINEISSANDARTEFFSNMSHDIRTPMNAINGFSKLAIDEIDSKEDLEDYLGKIVEASEHLLNLINNILDMSRIESGKMEISTSSVKLKSLLSSCADMVSVKMKENELDFVVDIDGIGDDTVKCDKLHFNQVILNLLSNAYKFTPKGGKVYLTGKLLEKADNLTYEIRVKDTGVGMSEEFAKHIWEPYSREKTEAVHETQGTGLGMVIVKNVVNLMNGTIELESEQGKGTEFIIVLPLEASEEIRTETDADNTKELMEKDFTGTTVLVVDDTVVNLNLANRLLRKHGFTVKLVTDGPTAVKLISESKPGDIDIVLMDVQMPVMDGLEAAGRIRALENTELAQVPIIAMTANAFESDVQKALDAGMNAHVPKPFNMEDLLLKIDANLKK